MSPTIGLDYYEGDTRRDAIPDFGLLRSSGVRFTICRAIYGRPFAPGDDGKPHRDPAWARDRAAMRAAGMKVGAYLFLNFRRKGMVTPSPEEQAQAFIAYVKREEIDLPPCIDVEEASDIAQADEMFDWIVRCAGVLIAHYGTWPMIYTSARVWHENLRDHSPGELLNCPLFLAKPWPLAVRAPVQMDGMPLYSPTLIPGFGSNWFCYQFQGDARDWSGIFQADADRWRAFGVGAKGQHVVWLQRRLKMIVRHLEVDGDYGEATKAAVKFVQAKYKLAPDGIFGLDTFVPVSWLLPAVL